METKLKKVIFLNFFCNLYDNTCLKKYLTNVKYY